MKRDELIWSKPLWLCFILFHHRAWQYNFMERPKFTQYKAVGILE